MKDFYEALASSERNAAIPKEDDFFGMLIGSWYIDYMDTATGAVRKGEWHFSRVLEGMAVQDVIVLPMAIPEESCALRRESRKTGLFFPVSKTSTESGCLLRLQKITSTGRILWYSRTGSGRSIMIYMQKGWNECCTQQRKKLPDNEVSGCLRDCEPVCLRTG